jgi:signal transduction histidine kinase/DNA-binding response OmpR family regulator
MQDKAKTKAQLITELDDLRQRVADVEASQSGHERVQQVQNALYRIADAASAVEDLEDFYAAMHGIVGELMVARNFYIALYDDARDRVNFPFYRDEKDEGDIPDPHTWHKMGRGEAKGMTAYVLRNGSPLLAHREKLGEFIHSGEVGLLGTLPESWLGVPLKTGERILGVLVVQSYSEAARYTERDKDLLIFVAQHIATALERARLLDDTRQRNAELTVINSVQQALAAELDMQVIYDLVGEQIRQSFAADIAYVALYDRQTNMIHFPYEYGDQTPSRPFGKGLTERIIESRQPLLINQNIEDRQAELETEPFGIQALSYLGVPIVVGQQAIGVISVQSISQEGRFDQADRNLLNTVAANVGAAIHNARLYQETQRRAEEMAALAEIGQDISATLDLPTVLERIANHARELLGADSSAVYLAEPGGQSLNAIVALGSIADEIKASPIQLGEGIIGDLAARKAAEVINDATSDPRAVHIPGTPQASNERLMAAPLLSDGQVSGMMAVWRTEPGTLFTEADLRFLEGLARQGAIAIGNAHLYEQAQEAQAAAEEANLAKSNFLANMSHELRTPLNAIIGFTRIVQRRGADVLPEKQIENLDKVLVSAGHLLGLINTILDIAKIEAGRLEVQPTTFDAGALVDVCTATTQPMLAPGRVSLLKDVAPDLPPVFTDQDKVKQILLNLLSNAAKFTHAGQISVCARRQGETLVVEVTDTGIGILEEDLERIFDEFHQVDNSTIREYGGTGLGLPISRHLARLLGGELTATSTVGVGSTFTLMIPSHYEDEGVSRSLQFPPMRREIVRSHPPEEGAQRDKSLVLAIDDDPDVIYLLQEYLGEADYHLVGALNGAEGVQKARELQPFAITLDILMPAMDGWQVLHELKTDVMTRDIPIIVLSIVDKKELGYRLGADDYLVKPLDSDAVLAALNRLPQANGGLPPKRLLVVDDDPQVADMVRQLLDQKRYVVKAAEDGVVALEVISRERPDLILLDLIMPRLDGFGVIEQLRQDPRHQRIPIVVLTAKTPTNEETARLQDDVSRVMRKQGLDGDTLNVELHRALSGLVSPSRDYHD